MEGEPFLGQETNLSENIFVRHDVELPWCDLVTGGFEKH